MKRNSRRTRRWKFILATAVTVALLAMVSGCPDGSLLGLVGDSDAGGTGPQTYTVTYHENGATSGTVPVDAGLYESGEQVTVAAQGTLVRNQDGFAWLFTAWNTASDGSGTSYDAESTMSMPSGNVTLYALWTPIGATGPAGGIVFYDKGEYSEGWRYLEAAPESTEWVAEWGDYGTLIGGDAQLTDIGDGQAATDAVVAHMQDKSITGTAAQLCAGLSHSEYSDWFLPSRDELNQMYLQRGAIGGFASAYYWSSSEVNVEGARGQHFDHGGLPDFYKYLEYRVRGARAF